MNDDKPAWWSFFAWPLVGAALVSGAGLPFFFIAYLNRRGPRSLCQPYGNGGECTVEKGPWLFLILGVALVVTGIVLLIRLRRKISPTAELDYEGESTMTEPTLPSKRPSVPMSEKTRKLIAFVVAAWTVAGLAVAIAGLSAVERSARPIVIATILLALLAGIGATIFALRGKRRDTMILLALSSLYPTYFWWVLSLIPIAMVFYLALDPLRISLRNPLLSRRKIRFASLLFVAALAGSMWLKFHVDPHASTETKRVQYAFQQMTDTVSKKEGVSTPWLTPIHAGVVAFSDGSKASLWVPKASPVGDRADCFYVDKPDKTGGSGYFYFACSPPKAPVILQRQGLVVVGFISETKASFATVTSGQTTVKVPVTYGYFIFPSAVSVDPLARFTISFSQPGQATCKTSSLMAPGFANSVECVIA